MVMRHWPILLVFLMALPTAAANHVDQFEVLKVLEEDDIPAIYRPRFTEEDYIAPEEEVVGLALGGESRVYPIRILNWHEVVDDLVGAQPIVVTYCPLCGSGIVFSRLVNGKELTFGVSGRLYKSNLVMVDNETRSLWSQMTGEAILGPMHGKRLQWVASSTLPWADWKARYPDSLILLPPLPQCTGGRTGMDCRDYEVDPYEGYWLSTIVYSDFGAEYTDTILHPKTAVLGLDVGGVAMAYPLFLLEQSPVVHGVLNRQQVLVTYFNGSAQAFDPGGRQFNAFEEFWMMDDTGGLWNGFTGESPSGEALRRLEGIRAMWFAWAEFHPGSGVYSLRPPSVLTFAIHSLPTTVADGEELYQDVRFNNTADFPLERMTIRVQLPSVVDYVTDDAESLSMPFQRSVEENTLTYGFASVPPGPHSFRITTRVREDDHPGIVFKSSISIEYEDADGRIIAASGDGGTFEVVERPSTTFFLPLLLPVAAVPPVVFWLLRKRMRSGGPGNG
ncbi:MAG: DUF3179 domain-containing protein [Thermoplasmata archaeon]